MNSPIEEKTNSKQKVLIIRMLTSADVCAIGLPTIRFFQKQLADKEIHFLTFGDMAEVIRKAEPSVVVHKVEANQWPDDFFQAMESFLGLAEDIIIDGYSQIVNLDTAFMPCFLARFLQDAGEPVIGNFLNMSIQKLITRVQAQSLGADYVNLASSYLDSTFLGMYKWMTPWWQSSVVPDGGYPEFYLTQCCAFDIKQLDQSICVVADKRLLKKAKSTKIIGLCLDSSQDGYVYPDTDKLKRCLEQQGYQIWLEDECEGSLNSLLKAMAASDLVVCKASGNRWFAQAVECPVLLISGACEPATLMPDFATDPVSSCPQHASYRSQQLNDSQTCNCDKPENLTESIHSIFEHFAQEQSNG
tara:strand:- start:158 stop:1234 length:1077 start_codon:yes stop_codon:yes gene_type:complete